MRLNREELLAKGWTEEEIRHAEALLRKAEEEKRPAMLFLEKAVYWILLAITVAGILAISLLVVPLMLFLNSIVIAILLATLGFIFGAFFNLLVKDIEWLDKQHHALSIILFTSVALASTHLLVTLTNKVAVQTSLGFEHNPWALAAVFVIALLTPFLRHLFTEWLTGTTRALPQ